MNRATWGVAAWALALLACDEIPSAVTDDDGGGGIDMTTDMSIRCQPDETRPCAEQPTCAGGVETCIGGAWGPCVGPAEVCDGQDNDCDGTTDEGVVNVCGTCDQPGVWNESSWDCATWGP